MVRLHSWIAVMVLIFITTVVFGATLTRDDLEAKKEAYQGMMAKNYQDIRNAEKHNKIVAGALAGVEDLLNLLQSREDKERETAEKELEGQD